MLQLHGRFAKKFDLRVIWWGGGDCPLANVPAELLPGRCQWERGGALVSVWMAPLALRLVSDLYIGAI